MIKYFTTILAGILIVTSLHAQDEEKPKTAFYAGVGNHIMLKFPNRHAFPEINVSVGKADGKLLLEGAVHRYDCGVIWR